MAVLEAVSESQPIGVSALARRMDMDKNTVQRILDTLGRRGWLAQDGPKGSWSLSAKVLTLSSKVSAPMVQRARPRMSALLASTQETITLWRLNGPDDARVATLVEIVESPQALRMAVPLGTTFDLARSSDLRHDIRPYLERFPNGRTAWGVPMTDRAPRYWVHDRSYPSATSIGSVIYDGPGTPQGTIAVVGPITRISKEQQRIFGEKVAEAARVISGF